MNSEILIDGSLTPLSLRSPAPANDYLNNIFREIGLPVLTVPLLVYGDGFFNTQIASSGTNAIVFGGINRVILPERTIFQSELINSPSRLIWLISHEMEHIRQNDNCVLALLLGKGEVPDQKRNLIVEGFAEKSAIERVTSYHKNEELKAVESPFFTSVRRQLLFSNAFKDHMTTGWVDSSRLDPYRNDLYFLISDRSYSSFLNDMNEKYLFKPENINLPYDLFETKTGSFDFSSKAIDLMERLTTEEKWKSVGFTAKDGSSEISTTNSITKLGFGLLRIPASKMSSKLIGRKEDTYTFILKSSKDVNYKFLRGVDNNFSTGFIANSPILEEGEIGVTITFSDKVEDVYIAVANNSITEIGSLDYRDGPFCFNGNDLRFDKVCEDECDENANEHYFALEKTCVVCALDRNGTFNDNDGTCTYRPFQVEEYFHYSGVAGNGLTSAKEICQYYIDNSYNGIRFVGVQKGVRWYCGYNENYYQFFTQGGSCIRTDGYVESFNEVNTEELDLSCN